MNQLEAPTRDCAQREDEFLLATAAESTKESAHAPERPATTSPEKSSHNNSAASSPAKMFPPPPPVELSEARRSLRLSSPTELDKHEQPEVDQDVEDVEDERMEEGNQGELDAVLYSACASSSARRESVSCEPMVCYDGFESVGKPTSRALPHLAFDDGEDDVVNFRSPIVCKPSGARSSTLSPTCVSALVRGDRDATDKLAEPSWSIEEFQQYLDMLDMLQEVCSSDGEEMSLSADSLGTMERLLTLLLPPGVEL